MITLYQFRHSAFCLKTRMALHAKKLQYRVEEVIPGIGQFEIFKLSGQKQVPVIVDSNDQIIYGSLLISILFPKICLIELLALFKFATMYFLTFS